MESGCRVVVVDNLSSGRIENVERWLERKEFCFVRGDAKDADLLSRFAKGCDAVFHLAANPNVRDANPRSHYEENVLATYAALEAARRNGIDTFVFTSSSTVYGDAKVLPTPEDYGPLKPISFYGGTKLAAEALISAYSYTYGMRSVVLRLANIIGPRLRRGVVYDFVMKLKRNPRELEILGDGKQTKSYLWVDDCVSAMLIAARRSRDELAIYNVGSEDAVSVARIAEIVVEEMGLSNVRFKFTGGVQGGRGWVGDVKFMHLSVARIKSLGWRPKYCSEEAVRLTARALVSELHL